MWAVEQKRPAAAILIIGFIVGGLEVVDMTIDKQDIAPAQRLFMVPIGVLKGLAHGARRTG